MKGTLNASDQTNPRKEIQKRYAKWVDDVCEDIDWKTNFTMEEVQAKYSSLAIELAIEELTRINEQATRKTRESIQLRIEYLKTL